MGNGGLDPFQLVAILQRATKYSQHSSADEQADFQQFIASVYGWMLERLDRFRPKQLANALQNVAKLGLFNEELVGGLLASCTRQFAQFEPADLTRLLRALATMSLAPAQDWTELYFAKTYTTKESFNRFQKYAVDDLVGTLSSLNALGLQPPPEWMAAFVEASLNQLRTMGGRDYVKLLLGLATCGWRPADPPQFAALLDRSFPLMGYMYPLELSQLAWALAQFGMPVSPQWGKAFHSRLRYQRRYLTPNLLSSILYSCAYLSCPPPPENIQGYLDDLHNQYEDATGDDLGGVAMALAQFQYMPKERWMDDFLITALKKLPATTHTGLANYIAALPAFGSGIRLNKVVSDAQARLDAMQAAAADQAAAAELYATEQLPPQEPQLQEAA